MDGIQHFLRRAGGRLHHRLQLFSGPLTGDKGFGPGHFATPSSDAFSARGGNRLSACGYRGSIGIEWTGLHAAILG